MEMENIPVRVIMSDQAALQGAARYAWRIAQDDQQDQGNQRTVCYSFVAASGSAGALGMLQKLGFDEVSLPARMKGAQAGIPLGS